MQHGAENLRPTSSLTSRAEHCRGTDIILCGFHVTELALQFKKKQNKKNQPSFNVISNAH